MRGKGWTIGVDVGGTFTDGIAVARDGSTRATKVPSTPHDPSIALIEALGRLAEEGVSLAHVDLLFHGTTIATNALVTGQLARVVLLATEGFRDVMSYRTGNRPRIYDLEQPRPPELVPRRDRREVRERLSSLGEVVVPLAPEEIERVVNEVAADEPEAVAVTFLFSYLDDAHERAMGEALRARFPDLPVTLSSEVAREFREYPRTATTVVNAGLRPVVGRYVRRAERGARAMGIASPFLVMQSNGGCVPADRADREAHRLVLSGPTAGVAGALALGARNGLSKVIALDMGGTSLDVCLVQGDVPPVTPLQVVEDHPILVPSVDIVTVGAGGGSIAYADPAGRLRVGPQSAGAVPGPAAYGRGGSEATLTDAHVVTGILAESAPLAGRLVLDEQEARKAVGRVGDALALDEVKAAEGIIAVATAHAVGALRRVSVERGLDPREFTLVAFGGAGPLLAGRMLDELGLTSVLVPTYPGLFSAGGLMSASLRIDESQTVLSVFDAALAGEMLGWYREARERLVGQLRADGIPASRIRVVGSVDCRYLGQGYELTVPVEALSRSGFLRLPDRFHDVHATTYGHAGPSEQVEVVTMRLSGLGDLDQPGPPEIERGGRQPRREAQVSTRRVSMRALGNGRPVPVYRRDLLRAGNRVAGPAIVDQMDSTTVVLAGQRADVDRHGNLLIRRGG